MCKYKEIQFCFLSQNTDRTPKDEAILLKAGLGRRTVNIADNAIHTEVSFKDFLKNQLERSRG